MGRRVVVACVVGVGLWTAIGLTPRPLAAAEGAAPGEQRITAEGLRRQLMYLASPEFEGREATERGGRAAAKFLAMQFAEAGLAPVGPAHLAFDAAAPSYYQPFKVLRHKFSPERTALRVSRKGPGETVRTYMLGTDFDPGTFVGNLEVSGPLAFAGYGISAPEVGYDDYAGVDVTGKVVLVFDHEPEETREDSRWGGAVQTRHATWEFKARGAQKHGAAALLVVPEPEASHRSFWDMWDGWYEWATGPRQSLDEEDVEIPVLYLRERVGRDILAAGRRDAAQLKREIESGASPRSQALADVTARVQIGLAEGRVATTENVVGLVEGSDPALKNEWVIVSAHHDHNGTSGGRVLAGADDDGSGTVCVLEMARALVSAERRPRRSVLFASWGAEEKGLLGSRYYALHPLAPLKQTAAILQLDMIGRDEAPLNAEDRRRFAGRDTRNAVNLLGTAYSPELRTLLGRLNAGLDLELDYKFDRDIEQMIFTRSDQWPFAQQDVPSLFFTTGLHPEYHTPADTPEKIQYEKMERIARLAYRTLWAIADADRRPAFQPVPVAHPR